MADATSAITLLADILKQFGGVVGTGVLIAYAGYKQAWVYSHQYLAMVADRDYHRDRADRAEKALIDVIQKASTPTQNGARV